ncbi:hypothetical protein [Glycomyces arizonensis]|uniref:hypothetical protein n=1 Tax=Glycomyces arizonensis TaxID=256035 RepID=UPI00042912AA|nr:hypothetical protein [Glycomyces arizonensis]
MHNRNHPQHNDAQPPATIRIEAHRLVIDAESTYARFTSAFGTGPAIELERIWEYSEHAGGQLFAHRPDRPLTANELALDSGLPPVDLDRPWFTDSHRLAEGLVRAGFDVTYTHLAHDGGHGTFCEHLRDIGVLSIGEPVGITAASYPQRGHLALSLIEAPAPGSCRRLGSVVLPAGHYLTCANSTWYSWRLRAACRIASVPSADTVTAIPETQIDRITATCNQCAASWTAEHGALLFTPNPDSRAREWHFRDATGRDPFGFDCPSRSCTGRIRFTN